MKLESWISHSKPKNLHETQMHAMFMKLSGIKAELSCQTCKSSKEQRVVRDDHQKMVWKLPFESFRDVGSIWSRKFSTNNKYQQISHGTDQYIRKKQHGIRI